MNKKMEAKDIAKYYFRLIAEKVGIDWNSDNDMEIERLVDLIIAASREDTVAHICHEWDAAVRECR